MSQVIEYLEKNWIEKVVEYRTCKWTNEKFPIFEKDIEMLNKISPSIDWKKIDIPLPTLSPKARQIRRLLSRNEWNFYKSRSSETWEPIISLYSQENEAIIYDQKEWWQNDWDPMDSSFEVDLSKSIMSQIYNLRLKIPRLNIVTVDNENSDYTTGTWYCKNCYLINSSEDSENCYYWKLFQNCKNCVDCSYVYDSEKLYECLNVKKWYNSIYLHNSSECSSCYYSDDLIWGNFCMFCSNLRNANYYFENKKLPKEEREEKAKDYLWSRKKIKNALIKFDEVIKDKTTKYAQVVNSKDSYWDILIDDKNCMFCYDVNNSEDCRYVNVWVEVKDNLDCNNMYLKPERSYEVLWTIWTYNVHFCNYVFNSSNLLYCQDCYDSKNLFWCIGLRQKEYCIFNKQYDKEIWEKKVIEIIDKMKKDWEWWEYFDANLSAFPYNDSLAYEYFPIKEVVNIVDSQVSQRKIINEDGEWVVYILEPDKIISKAKLDLGWGYKIDIFWKTKGKEIWIPENTYFLDAGDLKDEISLESEDIFKKAVKCSKTKRPYRITPQEFKFYKMMNLPIPELHPNVRYFNRLQIRPKRELHLQNCASCYKEILSVYSNEKKVYCEDCYNKMVY